MSLLSSATFQENLRLGGPFSTWHPPKLIDGAAMLATRLPDAEQAARMLDTGGVLVSNAALIDNEGMIRLAVGPHDPSAATRVQPEKEVRLPAMFLRGMGVGFIMSADTARELGVDKIDFAGLLAHTATPLDNQTLDGLWQLDIGDLAWVNIPDSNDPLGAPNNVASKAMSWGPIILLALVAVASAAITVLLSASQGRRDAATAQAVGASRSTLTSLGLAKAGVILGIGIPVGIGTGIALGSYQIAWNRHLEASGAWLDTAPAWGVQCIIAAGVAMAGFLAALILTRSPRSLVRRSLD